jgi:hypothetical protein
MLSCRWLGNVSAVSTIRVLAFQPVCIPVDGLFCQADSTVDHHRSNRRESQACICEKRILTTILYTFISNESIKYGLPESPSAIEYEI